MMSSVNEIATVNASREAEMQRVMIRLYKETMWPMNPANTEDDNNGGLRGSSSSVDDITGANATKEAEMELMTRIYKETICPMIRAEIMAKQQKFLSVIGEKFGVDLLTGMSWNFGNTASTSTSQALQLRFINGISTPVVTKNDIKGKDNTPFVLALVDVISGKIVTTGIGASMEVEILVLEGDANDDETENWSSDEFNTKIVRKWNGRKVLQGNTIVTIKEGVIVLDKYSFTHNSVWKENRNCRLGARTVNSAFSDSVKTAKTESFPVLDKRKFMYNKKPLPSSSDHVYRLYMISNRGKCFKQLLEANIKTVMDLLTLNAINQKRLKEVLDVDHNTWKVIMDHAQLCKDRNGIYLYYHPDGQKSNGVVFNTSGLVGLIAESQFIPSTNLSYDQEAGAKELIVAASEHWKEVVFFNSEASLVNDLESRTTLNSLHNSLSVVIPVTSATHDHTSLTSPQVSTPVIPIERCTNKKNMGFHNIGVAGQSQIPKRPASDHAVSNSPKKLRDDHSLLSPSTPTVSTSRKTCNNPNTIGTFNQFQKPNNMEHSDLLTSGVTDDDDCLQYFNFTTYYIPIQRWTRVWGVVGWISILSKVRRENDVI